MDLSVCSLSHSTELAISLYLSQRSERAVFNRSVCAQMSLDDMIKKTGGGKGKGRGGRGRGAGAGRGGAIKRGGVARSARQSAAPYKKPGKAGATLSSMTMATKAVTKNAALKQSGGLTTGAKIKVANLDVGVTSADISELFGEIGAVTRRGDRGERRVGSAAACASQPIRLLLGRPPRSSEALVAPHGSL